MGLDTVELILAFEESFGLSIPEADAQRMLTTRQVTAHIFERVRTPAPEDRGCLSMRAFHRLRAAFEAEGIARRAVRPDAKIAALLPGKRRREILSTVLTRAGFRPLQRLPFGLQFTFGRVREVVVDAVIGQHAMLRLPGHGWSRAQVREVVRAIMLAQVALRRFPDDAEFVKDLGLD